MKLSLTTENTRDIFNDLAQANHNYRQDYPSDSAARQPVHTVYGGANLFKAGAPGKLGSLALNALETYAPNFVSFAKVLGLPGSERFPSTGEGYKDLQSSLHDDPIAVKKAYLDAWLAFTIYERVVNKLKAEPVEDNRIDFEDGYGNRPDEEEDGHAIQAAEEVAKGMAEKSLSPFIGIRIKSFTEECHARSARTLDLFLTHLASKTGGKLPDNFVITLPKVTIPQQVSALVRLLETIEDNTKFAKGSLKIELMIETTQSIINNKGENTVHLLVAAAKGRCRSAIFGTYDYTATCNITAVYQSHTHPAADFARHVLQVSMAGTGINIVDGATTIMPIGPHKIPKEGPGLTPLQIDENQAVVHSAWKLHFDNIMHSLKHAYYQGWDLNPGQLPIRYAAVYYFFLSSIDDASMRLNAFLRRAAQATLVGNTFDDAATGQGLLNFFLRGMACGAITEEEVLSTGITLQELRSRSFVQIVQNRAKASK
ncbi:MAG: phosphoenolpyruvate kinase [SAR324 cluster bacterium]|nr:phosphoenolpyruvate kinase [SAR324 cluster bacterium]